MKEELDNLDWQEKTEKSPSIKSEKATKQKQLVIAPEILFIQIARVNLDSKIETPIKINTNLLLLSTP